MANKFKSAVLCVDDERIILQSLRSQIKEYLSAEYTLESAETGESALEIIDELIAENRPVPLVIVDYLMPGMKGDQLLVDIHRRSPTTLCIMLTGQADLTAVANAINHEALFRYMTKPWNKEDLIKTITEAFHRHDLEKSVADKKVQLEEQNVQLINLNQKLIEKMEMFYRFVPNEFLRILNIDPSKDYIELGESCQKEVAVLFTDIRSFTDRTQNMTSNETFELVNSFTGLISPFINKNRGFIDKFIGDAVLSVYLDVNDALKAIFEVLEALKNTPPESKIHDISLGFSLNFGPVQMGTVGYANRMETTILGSVVNIAAKIEKLNKFFKTTVLLTEEAAKLADQNLYNLTPLEEILVPGITNLLRLYTVSKKE